MKYLSFKEAREITRNLNLKNQKEWSKWIKGKSIKYKIPTNPNIYYKDEWVSLQDWLNSENNWPNNRTYYGYNECKKIIKNKNSDSKIPNRPDYIYKDKGWENWHTFLSIEKLPPIQKSKQFISFTKKARPCL